MQFQKKIDIKFCLRAIMIFGLILVNLLYVDNFLITWDSK